MPSEADLARFGRIAAICMATSIVAGLLIANPAHNQAWGEKGGGKHHDDQKHAKHEKGGGKNDGGGPAQSPKEGGAQQGQASGGHDKGGGSKEDPPQQQQDAAKTSPTGDPTTTTSTAGRQEQQDPPAHSENVQRPGDSLGVGDTLYGTSASFARSVSDSLTLDELDRPQALKKAVAATPVSIGSGVKITDWVSISGITGVPAAPRITVTSPAILQVIGDQSADMTFSSTAAGTYSILIKNDADDHISQRLRGPLQVGLNSVPWNGKDVSGHLLPAGQYAYYITAMGAGGTREPPPEGDGAIVIVGTAGTTPLLGENLMLVITIAAGLGTCMVSILFISRRRKEQLTLYLPTQASPIIEEIRERYPDAGVADYIEPAEGGVGRYIGVTIRDRRDADVDAWLEAIAEKTKQIADVDAVNMSYHGKMRLL
jgi:hypothetical protein